MCLSVVSVLTGNHIDDLEAQHNVSRPLGAFSLLSSRYVRSANCLEEEVGGSEAHAMSIPQALGQSETKSDPSSQTSVSNNQIVTPDAKSEPQSVIPDKEGATLVSLTLVFLEQQLIPILLSQS
jgi:hypothetical protein